MLVIIVGDDQALRLQLSRSIGPGRFELLCAVPNADAVPPVEDNERVAALLAHRTLDSMKRDAERLRERLGERVTLIAVASRDGHELEQIVGEVDDFVAWALGPAFLLARLEVVNRRFEALRTARSARPAESPVEDLLRSALGAGRDQLYVWDLATGRMTWPFTEDLTGLPEDRAAYEESVHPEDRLSLELALERHIAARIPLSVSLRRGTTEAGYRLFLDRGVLLGGRRDGRVIGLLTEIEDELLPELNRRLESRRSGVAEVAGALAEELNRSLLASFTSLDAAIGNAKSQPVRGDLQDARTALQEAFDWTRRLMALGRRQPPQPEYLALQDLVDDLVDSLARRLGSRVKLEVESRDSSGVVLADPMHLETVLTILCDRAGKAMPNGGRVRLTIGTTLLRDEIGPLPARTHEGRWVKLRLEDQGGPLPDAMVNGLFDPLSHGLTEGLHWTIALATVRSIIQQHEGFIRALNLREDGRHVGVAFEFFLPLVVRPPARLRRPDAGVHPPLGHGELVLVADDDELVRRMVERLLKGAGYRVLTAEDGREAVRIFGEHRDEVNLAILDIVMPEMGGRVASERIKELSPHVPFLFVSGYTMSIADTEFVQDPGRRFLPKPFNAGQLLREVHAAIAR